jgi:hypothetical protein
MHRLGLEFYGGREGLLMRSRHGSVQPSVCVLDVMFYANESLVVAADLLILVSCAAVYVRFYASEAHAVTIGDVYLVSVQPSMSAISHVLR